MITEKDDLGIIGVVVEDWDITKPFRAKTITTDYSSWIAYISRKAVPENTPITNTEYWKPLTRLQSQLAFDYNEFKEEMHRDLQAYKNDMNSKFNNLRLLVESFLRSTEFGVALANEFGDNTYMGVNQKLLTESLNKLWAKFEDITGEVLQGINMVVTPTFFVSEDGCNVHISANTVNTNGIFEKIQFFVDDELIYEAENAEYVSFDHHLNVKPEYDYIVMCKAKILGVEYTRQQIITRYNEFYIGAGSTYSDVMDSTHARQLNGTMRHNYDVTFGEGDKLIIVMGASLRPGFIRADLNGAEIEMTEAKLDAEGHVIPEEDTTTEVKFIGFMSEPWSAGDYNIDING